MDDTYLTLAAPGEAVFTEKRSRFLAFAWHVADEDEAKVRVGELRKKYYDARHVCYAYALGPDASQTRANDDGEPSGSAGKPILGQLRSLGLTYTLVAVVRYFGGVKLGTGGLAVAYKTAAAEALAAATTETCILQAALRVEAPYAEADLLMRYCREAGATITARDYSATHTVLTVAVRLADEDALRRRIGLIHTVRILD